MKKLLFFVVVGATFSSCASLNRATVVSTSTPAPVRTTTAVANLEVGKTRISYTYVPSKADSKRLSEAQLIDNAIYMALKENGNADVLVKVNYYITRKGFPRRIESISLSGYPAKYVDFRQPTEADYENFKKMPQTAADLRMVNSAPSEKPVGKSAENCAENQSKSTAVRRIPIPQKYTPAPLDAPSDRFSYVGLFDVGYSVGVGSFAIDRIELSTTHGCTITPYAYVGVGAGLNYYYEDDGISIPVFADLRGYPLRGKIKPYVSLRIGYSFVDLEGLYCAPSVGVQVKKFDFSIGYTMQKATVESYYNREYYASEDNYGAVTFRIGVKF